MSIQINGCTVIDNSRNITNANNMCVGVVTMTGSSGDIETPGTITAGGVVAAPEVISFSPSNGDTDLESPDQIILTYNQSALIKGTGNIGIRTGSADGTLVQTIGVGSTSVQISGGVVTITPTPPLLTNGSTYYVVVPAGAFKNSFDTPSKELTNYSFGLRSLLPGDPFEGGYLLCQCDGVRWIVAPQCAQVSTSWYSRSSAVTRAQQCTGCTGWFVPSVSQMQNPGYVCKTAWDTYSPAYWTNTQGGNSPFPAFCGGNPQNVPRQTGCLVNMSNGNATCCSGENIRAIRAFRCVSY